MNEIRLVVLTNWYNGIYCEKWSDSILRFNKLIILLKKSPEKRIICVTHGWFMRLISLYKLKRNLGEISLGDLLLVKSKKNLESIKLII